MLFPVFRDSVVAAISATLLVASVGHGQTPPPAPTLKDQIPLLAQQIKQYLTQDAGVSEVEVKRFECAPEINASAGTAIQTLLIKSLRDLQIAHRDGARFSCTGEYTFVTQDAKVLINTSIFERGNPKGVYGPIDTRIAEIEEVVILAGATGQIDNSTPETQKQSAVAAIDGVVPQNAGAPLVKNVAIPVGARTIGQVHVVGSVASAGANSPYGIEICVKDKTTGQYRPIALEDDEGSAYAPLGAGDVYAIRIFNRSKLRAAVSINIDGLNLFAISEVPAYKEHGKIIIPPSSDGFLLRGWHVNDATSAEFEVDFLPNALAAKLAGAKLVNVASVATITATFAVAVGPNEPLPPGQPQQQSLATKVGAQFGEVYQPVSLRFGAVSDVVSVRYDRKSPPNLPPGGDLAGPGGVGAAPPNGQPMAK